MASEMSSLHGVAIRVRTRDTEWDMDASRRLDAQKGAAQIFPVGSVAGATSCSAPWSARAVAGPTVPEGWHRATATARQYLRSATSPLALHLQPWVLHWHLHLILHQSRQHEQDRATTSGLPRPLGLFWTSARRGSCSQLGNPIPNSIIAPLSVLSCRGEMLRRAQSRPTLSFLKHRQG